jgi:hypothetical protein
MVLDNINLLDSCDERCGWAVVLCGAIAKGSFGVPIKGRACSKVDVDPLVMQVCELYCLNEKRIVFSLGVKLTQVYLFWYFILSLDLQDSFVFDVLRYIIVYWCPLTFHALGHSQRVILGAGKSKLSALF